MEETEVRREVVLGDDREAVWEAITEPERLEEWFATEVALDLRPGGEGVFRWEDGSVRRATVEVVEPGRRLGFRWEDENGDEPPSCVELTVEEVEDGTRLVVVERAEEGPQASAAGFGAAEWAWALELEFLPGRIVVH
jgi:uncharacterized protein YndB with AHSA1/START domain